MAPSPATETLALGCHPRIRGSEPLHRAPSSPLAQLQLAPAHLSPPSESATQTCVRVHTCAWRPGLRPAGPALEGPPHVSGSAHSCVQRGTQAAAALTAPHTCSGSPAVWAAAHRPPARAARPWNDMAPSARPSSSQLAFVAADGRAQPSPFQESWEGSRGPGEIVCPDLHTAVCGLGFGAPRDCWGHVAAGSACQAPSRWQPWHVPWLLSPRWACGPLHTAWF